MEVVPEVPVRESTIEEDLEIAHNSVQEIVDCSAQACDLILRSFEGNPQPDSLVKCTELYYEALAKVTKSVSDALKKLKEEEKKTTPVNIDDMRRLKTEAEQTRENLEILRTRLLAIATCQPTKQESK